MNRIAVIAGGVILLLIVSLAWAVNHYRNNAITYKDQRDNATSALTLANETISDMQVRQRDVAALDEKYTGELADAKAELEKLRADVAAGRKRLQVAATCTRNRATTAGGVGDASSARLTDSAEQDYFALRERITIITSQVNYLQSYINTQCLK